MGGAAVKSARRLRLESALDLVFQVLQVLMILVLFGASVLFLVLAWREVVR